MSSSWRTASSSSSPTSDNGNSTFSTRLPSFGSEESISSTVELPYLLSELYPDPHPFSRLNELVQKGALHDLDYVDAGHHSAGWRACISVSSNDLGRLSTEADGGSKQAAKRLAADALLSAVSSRPSFTSPSARHPADIITGLPIKQPRPLSVSPPVSCTVPATTHVTKKQSRVLAKAHTHLRRVRQMASERGIGVQQTTYLCIDVEAYEHSHEILEVGLAWIKASAIWPRPSILCRHFVVKDHLHLHNGHYVADNRAHFNFGRSEYLSETGVVTAVMAVLEDLAASDGPIHLVGPGIQHDVVWLNGLGVNWDGYHVGVTDIGQAYQAQHDALQLTKLEKMATAFGITPHHLHNAANDAYYGLAVCLRMMEVEDKKRYEDGIGGTEPL